MAQNSDRAELRFLRAGRTRQHSAAEQSNAFIGEPTAGLHLQPQLIRMKLFAHGNETSHAGHTDLAAEDADEVHQSGERGGVSRTGQRAGLESLEDNAANQSDVGAREPGR